MIKFFKENHLNSEKKYQKVVKIVEKFAKIVKKMSEKIV